MKNYEYENYVMEHVHIIDFMKIYNTKLT